jgi:hypothetical protein
MTALSERAVVARIRRHLVREFAGRIEVHAIDSKMQREYGRFVYVDERNHLKDASNSAHDLAERLGVPMTKVERVAFA